MSKKNHGELSWLLLGAALAGCPPTMVASGDGAADARSDASAESAADAAPDAQPADAAPDAAPEGGPDALAEAGAEPTLEAGAEPTLEAGAEPTLEAGTDAGMDAGAAEASAGDAGAADATASSCATMLGATLTNVGTVSGRLQGAGSMASQSCRASAPGGEAFYPLVVTTRAVYTIRTTGSADTVLSLRRRCDDASSELACNDSAAAGAANAMLRLALDPGTYHVVVDGASASPTGGEAFTLLVEQAPVASGAGTTCGMAQPAFTGFSAPMVDLNGVASAGVCSSGGSTQQASARWYRVDVPALSDMQLGAGPPSSTDRAALYAADSCVATDACAGLAQSPSNGAGAVLHLSNTGSATRTYYVAVSGTANPSFAVGDPGVINPNWTCGASEPALGPSAPLTSQGVDFNPASAACDLNAQHQWYSLTIPAGQRAQVTATPRTPSDGARLHLVAQDRCGATACLGAATSPTAGAAVTDVYENRGASPLVLHLAVSTSVDFARWDLSTQLTPIPTASNPTCAVPAALAAGAPVTGDLAAGSLRAAGSAPCLSTAAGRSLYYSVTVPRYTATTVTLTPTAGLLGAWDGALRAVSACSDATCTASADALRAGGAESLTLSNRTATPATYMVEVTGAAQGPSQPFSLSASNAAVRLSYTAASIPSACVSTGLSPIPGFTPNRGGNTAPQTLPATFYLDTVPYTRVMAGDMGLALLLTATAVTPVSLSGANLAPAPLGAPDQALVMPFWDELATATVFATLSQGTTTRGGSMVYVLDWHDYAPNFNTRPADRLNFQLQLVYPDVLELHYCNIVVDPFETFDDILGSSATFGFSAQFNAAGTVDRAAFTRTPGMPNSIPTPNGMRYTPN